MDEVTAVAGDQSDVVRDPVPSAILQHKAARHRPPTPPNVEFELKTMVHSNEGVFGSSVNKPEYRDVAARSSVVNLAEPVLVQIKSHVPIRGKNAFTVLHELTAPLSLLKANIMKQHGFPRRDLTLHLDSSEPLDESKSLTDLGYRFPPLLTIQGFNYEFTVKAIGVEQTVTLPWSVHLTATDLLQSVYKRWLPSDLNYVRLSVMNSDGSRSVLDTSRCFQYQPEPWLAPTTTFHELGVAKPDEPVGVRFLRTKEGTPLVFRPAPVITGATTLGEVSDMILAQEVNGELDGWLEQLTEEGVGLCAGPIPFDDTDEQVSPGGDRRLYFHGFQPHATISFNPTAEAAEYPGKPTFVPIDLDFKVKHLTDCNVFPGSTVLVEYYNPHSLAWSGDTDEDLRQELRRSSVIDPRSMAGLNFSTGAVVAAEDGRATAAREAMPDLLTIYSHKGVLVRVPVAPHTTMETVQHRVFCVTGDLPMFHVLQTDEGRLLMPHESVVSAQLFPQATLHSICQPRPWLQESAEVPKPKRHSVLSITEPDIQKGAMVW